jgi:hypothetical protein
MNTEKTSEDLQALNQETQEIWNQNAVWWDEQIGARMQLMQTLTSD